MRIVCPCRSLSVARACARVDSGLDKAKISSDRRVDADRPRLRAVFGGGKTFLHSLGHSLTSAYAVTTSAHLSIADICATLARQVRLTRGAGDDGCRLPSGEAQGRKWSLRHSTTIDPRACA